MTAKEKFEEYTKDPKWRGKIFTKDEMICFLDGLKAGGVYWHDLTENPNDLPRHGQKVWIQYSDGDGTDLYFFGSFTPYVVAWCEVPKWEGRRKV